VRLPHFGNQFLRHGQLDFFHSISTLTQVVAQICARWNNSNLKIMHRVASAWCHKQATS
jgi:hypothetical protein